MPGDTDLKTGRLLCPKHHALAHDPRFAPNLTMPSSRVKLVSTRPDLCSVVEILVRCDSNRRNASATRSR